MSKDQTTKIQMSLLQDFLANHSAMQEKEKVEWMIGISGMKLLESLGKLNQDGLLAKMCSALLVSKKVWSSNKCNLIWKKKITKSNVLLYQLQVLMRGTIEKESGLLPTPNTMDYIVRKGMRPSRAATNRKSGYLSEIIGKKINPNFLELMMGYPQGWTDIEKKE